MRGIWVILELIGLAWRRRPAVIGIHRLRVQGRTIFVPERVWLAHLVSYCSLKDAPQRNNEVVQADKADEGIARFMRNDRTPLMTSTKARSLLRVYAVYAQEDIDKKDIEPPDSKRRSGEGN